MPHEPFLTTLRELARCYQAFESYAATHIRTLGLTLPQFDIVATLGNTGGMNFRELGERTLITKGTLTGVVDRLVARGIVKRTAAPNDRRSQIVRLTADGEALFARIFPSHVAHLRRAFNSLPAGDLQETEHILRRLRERFRISAEGTAAGTEGKVQAGQPDADVEPD